MVPAYTVCPGKATLNGCSVSSESRTLGKNEEHVLDDSRVCGGVELELVGERVVGVDAGHVTPHRTNTARCLRRQTRPRHALRTCRIYTVTHNYWNPYEKWNIFVARPHLWSNSDWRTFLAVLRSTCSWWVTTNVGKPSATGQPTRPTQPFILSWSINE